VDSKISGWLAETEFSDGVKALVAEWSRTDSSPPSSLKPGDWTKTPSSDWRIDQLVTWVALNSFEEYRGTYGGFKDGYRLNEASAKRLAKLATAMSVVVLKKASASVQPSAVGDRDAVVVAVTSQLSDVTPIPIAVLAGSTFTITIPSNHTTGYQWRLANSPSTEILRSTGSVYNDPTSGRPGQGGDEVWTFEAVGKGQATIALEYVRPWEKDVQPAKAQTFEVTVR